MPLPGLSVHDFPGASGAPGIWPPIPSPQYQDTGAKLIDEATNTGPLVLRPGPQALGPHYYAYGPRICNVWFKTQLFTLQV